MDGWMDGFEHRSPNSRQRQEHSPTNARPSHLQCTPQRVNARAQRMVALHQRPVTAQHAGGPLCSCIRSQLMPVVWLVGGWVGRWFGWLRVVFSATGLLQSMQNANPTSTAHTHGTKHTHRPASNSATRPGCARWAWNSANERRSISSTWVVLAAHAMLRLIVVRSIVQRVGCGLV